MKRMKRISFEFLLNFLSVCFTLFIRHISRYTLHKSRKTSSKEPSKGAKTKLNRLLNRTISTTKDNTKNNKRTIQTTSRTAIFRIQDGNLSNSQYVYALARILFLRAYIIIRALVRVCVCEESRTTVPIVSISIVNLNSTVLNLRFRSKKERGTIRVNKGTINGKTRNEKRKTRNGKGKRERRRRKGIREKRKKEREKWEMW